MKTNNHILWLKERGGSYHKKPCERGLYRDKSAEWEGKMGHGVSRVEREGHMRKLNVGQET